MRAFAIPPQLDDGEWYHGSPLALEVLATGSTITRCRAVAGAFSHKPTCVGIEDQARPVSVCHNGTRPGQLYAVSEAVSIEDVRPHPESSFPGGALEWLTNRPLRLRKISDLRADAAQCDSCRRKGSTDGPDAS